MPEKPAMTSDARLTISWDEETGMLHVTDRRSGEVRTAGRDATTLVHQLVALTARPDGAHVHNRMRYTDSVTDELVDFCSTCGHDFLTESPEVAAGRAEAQRDAALRTLDEHRCDEQAERAYRRALAAIDEARAVRDNAEAVLSMDVGDEDVAEFERIMRVSDRDGHALIREAIGAIISARTQRLVDRAELDRLAERWRASSSHEDGGRERG